MVNQIDRNKRRLKRHMRVRAKVFGTPEKPRFCIYRSNENIYVQIIDDTIGKTLVSASSVEPEFGKEGGNKASAKRIGEVAAKRALEKGITKVVFDRSGYLYHGRVLELATGAREAGLKF